MAPVFVQEHHAVRDDAATTITVPSFDVGSGSNRSLVAILGWRDLTGGSTPTGSSVVFNTSESFTFSGTRAQVNWAGNNYITCEIWYLNNPSNATANVVGTISEAGDASDGLFLIVMEFTGANNGIGANKGSATGNSAAPSCTFTTIASDSLIVGGVAKDYVLGQSFAPGTDVTERADFDAEDATQIRAFAGTMAATGASQTFAASTTGYSSRWAIYAIELKAAAATGITVTPVAATCKASTTAPSVRLGSLSVTTVAAGSVARVTNPTAVLGSLSITPGVAAAVARVTDPTVVIAGGGTTVTPVAAACIASTTAPLAVQGSLSITTVAAGSVASVSNPVAVLGSLSLTPGVAAAIVSVTAPTVVVGGGGTIVTPVAAACIVRVTAPSVELGDLAVTPAAAGVIVRVVNPTVLIGGGGAAAETLKRGIAVGQAL